MLMMSLLYVWHSQHLLEFREKCNFQVQHFILNYKMNYFSSQKIGNCPLENSI